jgi:ApbE superfamily uncharacterized protein (UPF0280 family)
MSKAIAAMLPDGRRLHCQHGPIDLVIEAWGEAKDVQRAYEQAARRFETVLEELVAELPLLRRAAGEEMLTFRGSVAQRMAEAVWPLRANFITPMAAVAGAVAEEILEAMLAGGGLDKAYVNNGGDIALHLQPGQSLRLGVADDPARAGLAGGMLLTSDMPVRGIATSGRGGRSFSLGIADSVTVLANKAALADAAATMIANAVNVDDAAITRLPAHEIDPDSDLQDRLVTVKAGTLGMKSISIALDSGQALAESLIRSGMIYGAVLMLFDSVRVVGGPGGAFAPEERKVLVA